MAMRGVVSRRSSWLRSLLSNLHPGVIDETEVRGTYNMDFRMSLEFSMGWNLGVNAPELEESPVH